MLTMDPCYHVQHPPIIRGEEHKGILLNPCVLQNLEDLSHSPVQLTEGITKPSPDARVCELLAGKLGPVGVLKCHVEEERGSRGCVCVCVDVYMP